MEHLWLEILGRNKYSKALVDVIYNSERILNPSSWLDSRKSLLGHLTVSWDGMLILTGDVNIDMLSPLHYLTKRYQTILDVFELTQVVTHPTRITKTAEILIDHLIKNYPQKVTDTGIVPYFIISDHDAIYACINVRLPRFQPWFNRKRDMKNFKEESFVEDFSTLPMSIISYSDDPDEQLETINSLIRECIERHAPLKRIRVTGPPVPWTKCSNIRDLQKERDTARYEAHITPSVTKWDYFRSVRNKLKAVIRTARKAFIEKALYSSKSSEVW